MNVVLLLPLFPALARASLLNGFKNRVDQWISNLSGGKDHYTVANLPYGMLKNTLASNGYDYPVPPMLMAPTFKVLLDELQGQMPLSVSSCLPSKMLGFEVSYNRWGKLNAFQVVLDQSSRIHGCTRAQNLERLERLVRSMQSASHPADVYQFASLDSFTPLILDYLMSDAMHLIIAEEYSDLVFSAMGLFSKRGGKQLISDRNLLKARLSLLGRPSLVYAALLRGFPQQRVLKGGKLLGSGGFGNVYQSRWNSKLVAVKNIDLCKPKGSSSAWTEVAGLKLVQGHRHFVQMLAAQMDGLFNFQVILEKLDGLDAEDYIQRRNLLGLAPVDHLFNLRILGAIFRQVTLDLDHLHRRAAVHCDFKPANLYFTRSGIVKVLDMGATAIYDSLSQPPLKVEACTRGIAPCEAQATTAFDAWTIATSMLRMLGIGVDPMNPDNALNVLGSVPFTMAGSHEAWMSLRNLIKACLRVNPTQRMRPDQMLKHSFFIHYSASEQELKDWVIGLFKQ